MALKDKPGVIDQIFISIFSLVTISSINFGQFTEKLKFLSHKPLLVMPGGDVFLNCATQLINSSVQSETQHRPKRSSMKTDMKVSGGAGVDVGCKAACCS